MTRHARALALAAALLCAATGTAPAQEQAQQPAPQFFTLAGGDIGGNYFALARAICRHLNRAAGGTMRCSPEATPGSGYNLVALKSGEIEFAIVQSDWLSAAQDGTGFFATSGAFADLRGVAELYREAITLVVSRDSGIQRPEGVKGKRIDIGVPTSGRRATIDRILNAMQIPPTGFERVSELPATAAVDELCEGRLDAVALIVGHPDANVARALADCGARIVPFAGTGAGRAVAGLGSYAPQVIAAGSYPSLAEDVGTFGVTADLVTRADVADAQVKALLEVLTLQADPLGNEVPVLSGRDPASTWQKGAVLPPHGAVPASP
jgi:TRAP transporter TAXI family solute receptor